MERNGIGIKNGYTHQENELTKCHTLITELRDAHDIVASGVTPIDFREGSTSEIARLSPRCALRDRDERQ